MGTGYTLFADILYTIDDTFALTPHCSQLILQQTVCGVHSEIS